jgi:hypothetical protein
MSNSIELAVVFSGVGFYSGMKYQASQPPTRGARGQFQAGTGTGALGVGGQNRQMQGMQGANGMMRAGGRNQQGAVVLGEIIARDEKSITVKLPDGGSKIIFVSPATRVVKPEVSNASALEVGQTVFGGGETNSDGSVTAQTIQIQPKVTPPETTPKAESTPATP